jgi:hypothetical protein
MQKRTRFIIITAIGLLLIVAALIGTAMNKDKRIQLNDYAIEITTARHAASKYVQDGSGQFLEVHCDYLGKLAKEYDPSSDFLDCTSPDLIYLATPDTASSKVLTLSDEKHTATFTVDNEFKFLTSYEFKDTISPGFNKFGDRK